MMNDLRVMIDSSKSIPTAEQVIANKAQFKKGATWILSLLDFDGSDPSNAKEVRQFANDFVTKYQEML